MAEIIVTSTADSGEGSLRQAIADASDGDAILFDSTIFPRGTRTTIPLSSSLVVSKNLAIDGDGRVEIDGQNASNCWLVNQTGAATIRGFSIVNGAASNGGGIVIRDAAQAAIDDCAISSCVATNNGGGVYVRDSATCAIADCRVDGNCTATNGGALYSTQNSVVSLIDCTLSSSVYIGASVAFTIANGVSVVASLTLATGGTVTINDGAALSVTTSSTNNAATFVSAGRGYLALADGIDVSSATITNVVVCEYGAGVASFSARETTRTEIALEWTQTSATIPALIEQKVGDAWQTVVESAAGSYDVTVAEANRHVFRAFDGAAFHVDAAWHGLEASQYQVVGIVVGADAEEVNWQTVTEVVAVDGPVKSGQSITILARIFDAYDTDAPLLNASGNIVSVVYTLEKRSKGLFDYAWTPVEGHDEVEVSSECVLESLETSDAWTTDETGYNFILTPDTTEHTLFAEPGVYRFKVKITLAEGNPVVFYEEITVAE